MVSKRIKYARAHLTPRRHISILARPIWRRSYLSPDSNCLPRPFSVCRAALRARPSKRIKMMAQPKSVQRRFDRAASQSRLSLQYPRAHRGSLLLETRNRLFDLALPKKSALMHARRLARNRGTLANINSLLRGVRESRYQKYRIICEALQRRAAAREALSEPGDWEKHNRVLERLAAPKRRPPKPPRPTAARLVHRCLPFTASERILELAKPAVRPPGLQTDLKEDAFSVPPLALKAKCRPRIKILARPKTRGRRAKA
ncbi:hypothetical protein TSAR_009314 [Trichomalopsis sarcophagae]|uniref:Uncharacterized protein n=1 Tax=Trichomalopsis sarcophagae TaxID=543379 RepID=A0A232F4B7_9HYME|nr:hypothetical protein TSAR_009314 [Trichomalopsis sarcophagae]